MQAYHNSPGRPTYEHAQHYNPLGNPLDGVVPELRKLGVTRVKEDAEVERTRQKAQELRQESDKFRFKGGNQHATDEGGGGDAPDGKPNRKGKPKGRGRG